MEAKNRKDFMQADISLLHVAVTVSVIFLNTNNTLFNNTENFGMRKE